MQVYFIDDFAMPPVSRIAFLLVLLSFGAGGGPSGVAQEKPVEQATAPAPPALHLGYPDSAGGLEKLGKDIVKALKDGDSARAGVLIRSLLLSDPQEWYARVFGQGSAAALTKEYEDHRKDLPATLEVLFAKFLDEHATVASGKRFDTSCDDNAGEFTFGVLQARLERVPLYELRFSEGDRFYRLWALAYVDGGFRYVGDLRPPESFPRPRSPGTPNDNHGTPSERAPYRITIGGNVLAARGISRIQPHYPEVARREYLQGTVKLHAIIGKDGTIQRLQVLKGYCSLAEASLEAVRQWRYRPTLFNGQPVEVDTTIDVIFTLNR